jgi:general secretion pathway protein K
LDDASGRFNLNSLVNANGLADDNSVAEFKALLRTLELEEKWASLMVDWIDRDHEPYGFEGAEDSLYSSQTPAYRTLDRPISSISELLALPGFGRDRYLKLAPFVTALPQDAKLNICTASGEVLDAMTATAANKEGQKEFGGASNGGGTASALDKGRQSACFPGKEVFLGNLPEGDRQVVSARIEEKSRYFRLTSIVTVGNTQFALYSLLYRNGAQVRPIMRSFSSD